ncbi:MAG: glycosyltransferase family 39 protein [Chitinophagaceae bacterium]|jgi:4-amino-4-deoxy-L-arabinose transferase-like glycosyltransferase|nr:glycosyltransferase family 39 protein [Bacteroidota bacterium]MBP6427582.1 glycosyltransferase family 39 protein [Bacteroidia bacterium]MBP6479179.1 glycosyltransferase family 39 protein [Chitinophagaceae bacterium]
MTEFFKKNFKYIFFAGLVCIPLFSHLGSVPIQLWDEARLNLNAYEMHLKKDFIVTYYGGEPDLWNTKPPFLIWCQALLMDVVGPNELAMRLPSAFAALLTCIALLIFSIRYLKNFWIGFIAAIILVTAPGYVSYHGTRTGDYDAMLTLFTTLSCLFYFAYSETRKNKYLYYFFLSLAFGVLTKSVAALFFAPAIVIFALMQKQVVQLLRNKHFYFGLGMFLFLTIGYYLIREMAAPGYLSAVFMNELGGRFLTVIENHKEDGWYFYDNFIRGRFSPWYLLLPLGFLTGFWSTDEKIQRVTKYFGILTVIYFVVITFSKTKLEWYDLPLYPMISFITALFVHWIFELLGKMEVVNKSIRYNFLPFAFLFLILLNPYRAILDKVYLPKFEKGSSEENFYELGYYIRDALRGKHDLKDYEILQEDLNTHLRVYVEIMNSNGQNIKFIQSKEILPNTLVVVQNQRLKDYLRNNFNIEELEATGRVVKYKVNEAISNKN